MSAGLTKSSEELHRAWQQDRDLYLTTLSAAISAYEENDNLEELLRGCVARLVSVVDAEDGAIEKVIKKALEIVLNDTDEECPARNLN